MRCLSPFWFSVRLWTCVLAVGIASDGRADEPTRKAVLLINEDEYHTETTLPQFAKRELEPRGFRSTIVQGDPRDPNRFVGLENLRDADVLILSVRRRLPPKDQLDAIRHYLKSGRPLVAIRTSSHAFAPRVGVKVLQGQTAWPEFDREVLGGTYRGHHNNALPSDSPTLVRRAASAASHPIAKHLPRREFKVSSTLYRMQPLAKGTELILVGQVDRQPEEPVAWTHRYGKSRVFYTSLGHVDDFRIPAVRQMLADAVLWACEKDVSPAKTPSPEKDPSP